MDSFSSLSIASSRFCEEKLIVSLQKLGFGDEISIGDVIAATGHELPYIQVENLRFDKVLGQGSSFEVCREEYCKREGTPYYVAVKRFRSHKGGGRSTDRRKRYTGFLRELRVLMHPPLKSHGCIVQIVAHGWINDPQEGGQPYLVMDYSDHGTLVQYLQRCNIPLGERRELILDAASALKAIHDSRIVHGDIKPENVLVFDNDDNDGLDFIRPQVARLSDFSSAIFEQDITLNMATYLGTGRYLAPELGRSGYQSDDGQPTMDLYQKADIYSFGLLIWEVLNNGQSYIESAFLQPGEEDSHFPDRMSSEGEDALYGLAKDFLGDSSELKAAPELSVIFTEAISMSLKERPECRASMGEILQTLAQGTR